MPGTTTVLTNPTSVVALDKINRLSNDELDQIPIGVIELDANGTICFYNATESKMSGRDAQKVLGKNFFHEIAPCTNIPQFSGRFVSGVRSGKLSEQFVFNFDFEMTPPVKVVVELHDGRQPGKYWLFTKVIKQHDNSLPDLSVSDLIVSKTSGASAEEFCASEPIATPDKIQSWGALVTIDLNKECIVGRSENFWEILSLQKTVDILDEPLSAVFQDEDARLCHELSRDSSDEHPSVQHKLTKLTVSDEYVDLRFVAKGRIVFVEITIAEQSGRVSILPREILDFNTHLSSRTTVEDLCQELARLLQKITEFERVVAYRFSPNWEGQTIAEAMRNDSKLPSFQDLYFPASDIPPQARAMHERILTSFTPSRDYVASDMALASGAPAEARNLEGVHLRSVSPVRAVYHKTIGVNGSATCSLKVGGNLWGMVILHDSLPRHLNYSQKVALATLTQTASSRLELLIAQDKKQRQIGARKTLKIILDAISASDSLTDATLGKGQANIMNIFNCSGAAIWIDGEWRTVGLTPPLQLIDKLAAKISHDESVTVWGNDCLSEFIADFKEYATESSGAVFAAPIPGDKRNAIMWFFPERVIKKDWAGNPTEKLHFENVAGKEMVLPRLSFAKWTEFTSYRSLPIGDDLLEIAEDLRVALGGFLARRSRQLADLSTQLQNRNSFLSAVLDSLTSAIFTFETDGTILSANVVAGKMFGCAEEDFVGKNFRDLFDEENISDIADARADLDAGKLVRAMFMKTDNSKFLGALSTGKWVRSSVEMRVATIRDISDMELLEKNAYRQSKLEAIGQITSSIAHDYNNFLAIVSGNLELISMLSSEDKVTARVTPALNAVQRASGLTDKLLSLVRTRTPKTEIVNISRTIEDCRDLLHSTLGAAHDLVISYADNETQVLAERGQIENSLVNLLNNARDAMHGEGCVQIDVLPLDPLTGLVPVVVRDNGEGMSDDQVKNATEPFFTTKDPGSGSGLGLSAVQRDLNAIGGQLELNSAEGTGTTITMKFPGSELVPQSRQADTSGIFEPSIFQGKRLLLVDDEKSLHDTLHALLNQLGLEVITVSSQEAALKEADKPDMFDFVLSDVNLKEGPVGFGLVKSLLNNRPNTVGMCMSGSDCSKISEANRYGIPLLNKPFQIDTFVKIATEELTS